MPPLVIVRGRTLEHHAGIVRRAAPEDPRPQLRAVLALGLPGVGEREPAGVEHVLRPTPARVRPVVGPSLDQADLPAALAQARSHDAASRPSANNEHIERHTGGHAPSPSWRRIETESE
jgi:hypothetical protein